MPTTAQDLIYGALRYCGVTAGPNRTPSPDQLADGLKRLNQMIGQWNIDPLMIYAEQINAYTLTAGTNNYTFGDGGNFDPDAWPASIERANIIIDGTLREPVALITAQEWAAISTQTVSSIPQKLYNDGNYPLSKLYLYPAPDQAYQLELYWWRKVQTFAATSTQVSLPDGYEEAIVTNLAVRLAPTFQVRLDPTVVMLARESKARVESKNAGAPLLGCELTRHGLDFDYRTGE